LPSPCPVYLFFFLPLLREISSFLKTKVTKIVILVLSKRKREKKRKTLDPVSKREKKKREFFFFLDLFSLLALLKKKLSFSFSRVLCVQKRELFRPLSL